ncbi:MAG: alpha/beta hydrolase [bacterium]|nr:alpha/beta hydrolase [bacterium]
MEHANGLVLTHGAGGNRDSPLLVAVAGAFEQAGYLVKRVDLSFRRKRPTGPPRRGDAERDRDGLRQEVAAMRKRVTGKVLLGGASYGGRQASMLVAEEPGLVDGLLLLSYPLHPPGKPDRLRTEHLPQIQAPALFAHGTRDPFGSIDELRAALDLIPAPVKLLEVTGAGHDLKKGKWEVSQLPPFFSKSAGNVP